MQLRVTRLARPLLRSLVASCWLFSPALLADDAGKPPQRVLNSFARRTSGELAQPGRQLRR